MSVTSDGRVALAEFGSGFSTGPSRLCSVLFWGLNTQTDSMTYLLAESLAWALHRLVLRGERTRPASGLDRLSETSFSTHKARTSARPSRRQPGCPKPWARPPHQKSHAMLWNLCIPDAHARRHYSHPPAVHLPPLAHPLSPTHCLPRCASPSPSPPLSLSPYPHAPSQSSTPVTSLRGCIYNLYRKVASILTQCWACRPQRMQRQCR